jgi:hypothetical protein
MISDFKITSEGETYVVDDISEINEVLRRVTERETYKQASLFMNTYRDNIIAQLKMINRAPHEASLTGQIINSISKPVIKFEGGALKVSMSIDHPLASALNDGTGIYGPNHTMITPKSRQVMFIPLEKLKFYYQQNKK